MNGLKITKFIVGTVVGIGASKIIGQAIRNNVSPRTAFEAFSMSAATFVLCGMVGAAAVGECDKQIDGFVNAWRKAKTKYAEAKNAA